MSRWRRQLNRRHRLARARQVHAFLWGSDSARQAWARAFGPERTGKSAYVPPSAAELAQLDAAIEEAKRTEPVFLGVFCEPEPRVTFYRGNPIDWSKSKLRLDAKRRIPKCR